VDRSLRGARPVVERTPKVIRIALLSPLLFLARTTDDLLSRIADDSSSRRSETELEVSVGTKMGLRRTSGEAKGDDGGSWGIVLERFHPGCSN